MCPKISLAGEGSSPDRNPPMSIAERITAATSIATRWLSANVEANRPTLYAYMPTSISPKIPRTDNVPRRLADRFDVNERDCNGHERQERRPHQEFTEDKFNIRDGQCVQEFQRTLPFFMNKGRHRQHGPGHDDDDVEEVEKNPRYFFVSCSGGQSQHNADQTAEKCNEPDCDWGQVGTQK